MSNSNFDGPQSVTSSGSGSDLKQSGDDDSDYGVVQNQVGAYQGEPLGNLIMKMKKILALLTMLLTIQTGHL